MAKKKNQAAVRLRRRGGKAFQAGPFDAFLHPASLIGNEAGSYN